MGGAHIDIGSFAVPAPRHCLGAGRKKARGAWHRLNGDVAHVVGFTGASEGRRQRCGFAVCRGAFCPPRSSLKAEKERPENQLTQKTMAGVGCYRFSPLFMIAA